MHEVDSKLSFNNKIIIRLVILLLLVLTNAIYAVYLTFQFELNSGLENTLPVLIIISIIIAILLSLNLIKIIKNSFSVHSDDVNKFKSLADALRTSEEKYRGLFEQSEAAIFIFDALKNFIDTNQAGVALLGYSKDELLQMSISDVDVEHEHVKSAHEQDFSCGEIRNFENKLRCKDGSIVTVLNHSIGFVDSNGKEIGILSTLIDITLRNEQEEQNQRTEKMNALGKVVGGIAHDYNNMLGVVLGYANLLEEALKEQPLLLKYVDSISHAGERGTQLTKKLLAFSRKKPINKTILNPNDLFRDIKHLLEKSLTARIKLVYDLSDEIWPILVDGGDLEDAILNMSLNAMHAIDGTGQITIQTTNVLIYDALADHLEILEGEYVLISISDTGCGMDNIIQNKIFDPFFTTKGDEGTGLGLSQVYGFVKSCGGTIRVYSEPQHGSRFMIYFPHHEDMETAKLNLRENKWDNIKGSETILIVDDELTLLNLTHEILSEKGYYTFRAESAKQALEILKNESIDLVICDIIMPEMDGYQLAAIVQEEYPNVKVQLVSGFSDKRHVEMVSDDLQINMLHKPYSQQALLQRLKELFIEE